MTFLQGKYGTALPLPVSLLVSVRARQVLNFLGESGMLQGAELELDSGKSKGDQAP